MRAPGRGETVVARAPAVFRDAPFGLEETALLQPMQCLHERGIFHAQPSGGSLLQPLRDLERMHRGPRQRLEDQDIERAFHQRHGPKLHRVVSTPTLYPWAALCA